MANLSDDILRWSLEINGNPAQKALGDLQQATYQLEQSNKKLRIELQKLEAAGKKNSQEYQELEKQIKSNATTITTNKVEMAKMRKEIGINGLTVQQLRTEYRHLKIQMDNTTPNTPEWNRLNKQLKEVKGRMDELNVGTKKAGSIFSGLKSLLPGLGITAAVAGIIKLGKEFLNLATSMEQVERKAKIVFGESLTMVNQAAAENAKRLGLTRNEFVKAAASTADLLVPLGFARDRSAELSVKLTNLSGALDEWSGGTLGATQVNEILTKALLGEAEQIKQLGIVIDQSSQDYNKRIKVMMETQGVTKEQARALDILNQIYQKSADAQTAFAQTGDSLLRQQKSIGTAWRQLKENVTEWFKIPTEQKIENERIGLNTLVNSIMAVNNDQEARNRLIKELQNSYPAFLQNLNLETLTNEALAKRIKEVNDQYDNRVAKAVYEEQMADVTEKQRKNFEKTDETLMHITELYQTYVKNKKEGATVDEMINSLLKDDLNVLATQEIGLRGSITLAVMKYNKLKEKSNQLEEEYNKIKEKRDKEEPGKTTPDETQPSPEQIQDYYDAVNLGVIKGEEKVRILTQQELDKLAEVRKQKQDEQLEREKEAAKERQRLSEQEAAEKKRLEEQQAAEQQKLLESQEEARQQIIRGAKTLIEKENLDYEDRLKAAGLFGKAREEMTDEELQALEILEREHHQAIKDINDQSFNDNLSDLSLQYEREKIIRERKYTEELLALGDNEEAKKALTKQYQQEELQKQSEHLQAMISQYQAELDQGIVDDLFSSIPDMGIEDALLSDEEKASLQAKIEELKLKLAELGIAMAGLKQDGEGETEVRDLFGMTPEDWKDWEKKFEKAIVLAQAASDMWAGLNRVQANKDAAELQRFESNTKRRKELLDQQLADNLISQKQYDQAIASMDTAAEQRKIKIARDAARREKSQAYFGAIINTAASIVKTIAELGATPWGLIAAAIAAAMGAVQIGIIASEPLPQLTEGGYVKVMGKDDKKQYNAIMAPDKRGLVKGPTILVAENKPEYVVPGRLLESNPTVQKYVEEIETIRTGRQFEKGGYTRDGSYRVPENLINTDPTVEKYVYVIEKISAISEKVDTRGIESIYEFYQKEINTLQNQKSESIIHETEQLRQINTLQKEKSESLTKETEQLRQINTLQKDRTQTIRDTSTIEKQIERESREASIKEQDVKVYTQQTRELITQREELVTSFINESLRIREVSSTMKESLTGIGSVEVMLPKVIQPAPYVTTLSQGTVATSKEVITNNTVEKTFTDPQLTEALNRFSEIMEQIDRNGLQVPWIKIKEKFDQYDQIQSRVNSR
jgi:hypothetical protein